MPSKQFVKAVLITGFIAGTLDAAAASIQYCINKNDNPAKVFRSVAGAVFKEKTQTGSVYTWAAWGLLFHFLIAMLFTLFFFLFYRQIRSLLTNKFVAGIIYGIFVWCVMNFLVVPLAFERDLGTHITALFSPEKLKGSLTGLGIIIIAIGLPISLLADRYYSKKIN